MDRAAPSGAPAIGPAAALDAEEVRRVLGRVVDPEIPVVTIEELGILRGVGIEDGTVVVTITPTYSGCPAMDMIRQEIAGVLAAHGIDRVEVRTTFSPAWSTDWITPAARDKLEAFGIAPPHPARDAGQRPPVLCPRCRAEETHVVAEFGSTACKALMVCERCGEPFDRFKEL